MSITKEEITSRTFDAIEEAKNEVDFGVAASDDWQVLGNNRDDDYPDPIAYAPYNTETCDCLHRFKKLFTDDANLKVIHVEGMLRYNDGEGMEPTGEWWSFDITREEIE